VLFGLHFIAEDSAFFPFCYVLYRLENTWSKEKATLPRSLRCTGIRVNKTHI